MLKPWWRKPTCIATKPWVAKANTHRYIITVLKQTGAQLWDLVRCYCTFTWPLLEYDAPVWHPGLTGHQADLLELVQRQCLPTLLPDTCYTQTLRTTGLSTLQEHRSTLCLNFAHRLLSKSRVQQLVTTPKRQLPSESPAQQLQTEFAPL